jgi:cytochrome c oxidase subunit 1
MSEPPAPTAAGLPAGAELERARSLTLRYVVASTAILGAAGILGVLLRDSQGDLGRLPAGWFYALMTAHGLGAFVGWAAFAVMGFSYWVLAQVGFPLRRLGNFLAELTWWLMVVGVAGVVITCLAFKFGGSWVFLYPIAFHSAGEWGEWTSFFFNLSVLLVGLSIVTWCLSILDTVLGPALHAVSTSVWNRLGVAMGFGYVAPGRFATNPQPVPYAVIPLTVIAIDMIIATLPLAVLLVEMMIQSLSPSVHVDPLLAKNVLWWFGHPVVYLLLFPAVAIYYLLVPRYAGRPLVAGNVIAVAWAIAVAANVLVWAHHIYIDYPSGSPQAAINVAMQPMTYSLTVVSALSLYSLFFTIYRSNWTWNAASTRALPRSGQLAPLRPIRRHQRDDRLRSDRPQHALDRRPLPPNGAAEHRLRDHRGDLPVPPRTDRQGAPQRIACEMARLADLPARDSQLGCLALSGAARGAAPVRRAPAHLRRRDPSWRRDFDRAWGSAAALRLQPRPDSARQGRRGAAGTATAAGGRR